MATGTPATLLLARRGIAHTLHEYEHAAGTRDFGREAAAAIGADEMQVFKTLVVDLGGGKLAVAVAPVSGMLDLKATAKWFGVKHCDLADPKAAQLSTGYLVGGISPIAQKNPLPTVIDETAELFDTIFVSAGKRGLQVELAPKDLANITGAGFADIAR
ncbi:MAG: Cys-tRNA(Pro) deacylase [Propionibacteriaceae bacterium]|jgi:Cys-tRNA(Pro)/Cys-tRNA(Cys) deacylase|nr:Cys-tRNA(Pro) deacylase [Propionibacteriaceae bacterium]